MFKRLSINQQVFTRLTLSTSLMILLCIGSLRASAAPGGGNQPDRINTTTTLTLDRSFDDEGSQKPLELTSQTYLAGTTQAPPTVVHHVATVTFYMDNNVYSVGGQSEFLVNPDGTATCYVDISGLSSKNGHTFKAVYSGFNDPNPSPNKQYLSSESANEPFTVIGPPTPSDTSAPTTTPKVTDGTLGDNGWYTSGVTVTLTAGDPDGDSDVKQINYWVDDDPTMHVGAGNSVQISFAGDGTAEGTHIIWFSAVDQAGNAEECIRSSDWPKAFMVKIDTIAPSITASADRAANENGWYNDDVTISFICSDTGSGLFGPSPSDVTLTNEGANQSVTGTVSDAAGNSASATISDINIDKTAPSITATPDRAANENGWYNADVTVSFAATDDLSGIAAVTDSVTLGEGANQSVTGTAIDKAGNVASTTLESINIDKTAPTITGAPDRAANANGWYNADVTVSFTASDGLSGIATVSDPVTLGEGAAQSVTGTATDKAGNTASVTVSGINIDKTPPAVKSTITSSSTVLINGQPVALITLNGTASVVPGVTDALSGVDKTECGTLDTSTVGLKTLSCTAYDKAGNSATGSVQYAVGYKVVLLYDTSKSHKAGSTYPIKISICDANGVNLSSPNITVKAMGVKKTDNTADGPLEDSGNANPDSNFRYDAALGGYIFNLSLKGYTTGTYKVLFTVGGDPTTHEEAVFNVK